MEICASHYNENLNWLKESPWPVNIVHHEGGSLIEFSYIIENRGYEATAYLKYIIDRYDSLPEYIAFIHGHETAEHQQGDRSLIDMIKTANIEKYKYIPLNNRWKQVHSVNQLGHLSERWSKLLDISPPRLFSLDTCAQFIVGRERILLHTKEKYRKLYETIQTKDDATILEYTWHHLFGEPIWLVPKQDYFIPKLTEILYTECTIPFEKDEFKWCYTGENTPVGMIRVSTQDQYDWYKIRSGQFFKLANDKSTLKYGNICKDTTHMNFLIDCIKENWEMFYFYRKRV